MVYVPIRAALTLDSTSGVFLLLQALEILALFIKLRFFFLKYLLQICVTSQLFLIATAEAELATGFK